MEKLSTKRRSQYCCSKNSTPCWDSFSIEQFKEALNVRFCFCKLFHKWNKSIISKRDSIKSIIGMGKLNSLITIIISYLISVSRFDKMKIEFILYYWKQKRTQNSILHSIFSSVLVNILSYTPYGSSWWVELLRLLL